MEIKSSQEVAEELLLQIKLSTSKEQNILPFNPRKIAINFFMMRWGIIMV